jgi:hypothetical protein
MLIHFTTLRALTAGLFCAAAFVASSQATTIYTFDFTQNGYTPGSGGGILGSFSGTADPSGYISLSNLITFSLEDAVVPRPAFFSFNIDGGSSSLDVATVATSTQDLCIGAAAAFGGVIAGINCGPGGNNGYLGPISAGVTFTTQQLPTVTLASMTTTQTPEPGTVSLLAMAAVLMIFGALRLRRPSRTRKNAGQIDNLPRTTFADGQIRSAAIT